MSYEHFAQTYDKLMDKSLYERWYQFTMQYAKLGDTVVDVACGSGSLACLLEKQVNMLACDLSENMLTLASEKTTKTQLFLANMTELPLEANSVDVITCFADSLCYLENEELLKQAFRSAYGCLKSNGYYLFDVHSIFQMTHGYKDYTYQYVDDDTLFIWQSYEGEFLYSVEHDISCAIALTNGMYERYDEVHFERTYPLESYMLWLKQAGFKVVNVFDEFGRKSIDDTTKRWFFVCQKTS